MDREKIDGWCEKGILGLVLGILVFGPLALGAHGTWQFLVIQALTLGVMALWLLRLWIGPSPKLLWPPICWAVLAFVIYAIVRYLQADIEYVAREELIRILVYGFLFWAILNNVHRQESIQIVTVTLVFLGMAISFYAGYQFFTKSQRVWNVTSPYIGRAGGTFIYPNHLAGFLEMLVPLGLCQVLMGRSGHVLKIILGYASFMMLGAIGVTLSRGGWVVTGVMLLALGAVLVVQRDYRIQGLVLMGVLVLAGALAIPRVQAMQQRVAQMKASGKADDMRFSIWQPAVEIWRDHIWWGAGPAHFDYRFPQYRPTDVQLRPFKVHNDYLNTLVDWGVAGAVLVASAWVLLYGGIFKNWRSVRGGRDDFSRKKSNKFAFLVGASVGLFAILLHSFLDFNMQLPAIAILAVALMAMLTSQWRFATERYWFRVGWVLKGVATVCLLAGAAYLGREGWQRGREYVWLRQAEELEKLPVSYTYARIEALEKAFAVDLMNFETTYAIGECYRLKSWVGNDDYVDLAKKAMVWYQRGMKLDPYDSHNWLGYGMCLDWIGSGGNETPQDSSTYYDRANALDPNSYFITVNIGWHYVQIGDYAAARSWFERSRQLEWGKEDNRVAHEYLPIVERRLKEAALKAKPASQ
ncbi:MAG: O-antigen polymerase [Pedosphaera sp.]|nr:O-antigen polymerase [Pedosphaera sp.]